MESLAAEGDLTAFHSVFHSVFLSLDVSHGQPHIYLQHLEAPSTGDTAGFLDRSFLPMDDLRLGHYGCGEAIFLFIFG